MKKAEKPATVTKPIINAQPKVISPSASLRSRPQSFAQKLRSTGKSVKGYMNLSEGIITPNFGASPSSSGLDKFSILSEKVKTVSIIAPKCWKTIYHLLDLYAIKPETKMISHRLSVPAETSDRYKGSKKFENLSDIKEHDVEKGLNAESSSTPVPPPRELSKLYEIFLFFYQNFCAVHQLLIQNFSSRCRHWRKNKTDYFRGS